MINLCCAVGWAETRGKSRALAMGHWALNRGTGERKDGE